MATSNIDIMYEEIVADLAERAKLIQEEYNCDQYEAIAQAEFDGLIYGCDQAYVIAHAFMNGLFKWGGEIDYVEIIDNLRSDIMEEMK